MKKYLFIGGATALTGIGIAAGQMLVLWVGRNRRLARQQAMMRFGQICLVLLAAILFLTIIWTIEGPYPGKHSLASPSYVNAAEMP